MAGRYERVRTEPTISVVSRESARVDSNIPLQVSGHDNDSRSPVSPSLPRQAQPIPNSPPPSFRSRASSISSRERHGQVDSTLADAFDADNDSDDETDDRQRLVRLVQVPAASARPVPSTPESAAAPLPGPNAATPAGSSNGPIFGGGIQSDGVFSNLTAKPDLTEKEEQPPVRRAVVWTVTFQTPANITQTYEQAAADQAPPYWETTILAPGLGGPDEVYIDGMPVGSIFSFVWNGMISMSFQLVGFLLTYLLHSTHAAKNGSRAGLGITLIQYGFYMKGNNPTAGGAAAMGGPQSSGDGYASPPDPNSHDFDPGSVGTSNGDSSTGSGFMDIAGSEWVAYILMIVGWFILIRSVSEFVKARRHEQLVLQSPDRGLGVAVIAEGEPSERVV